MNIPNYIRFLKKHVRTAKSKPYFPDDNRVMTLTKPDIFLTTLFGIAILLGFVALQLLHKAEYYQRQYNDAADIIHEQSIRIDGLQTRQLLTEGDCQIGVRH